MDPWPMINTDRVALADYLDTLSADEWALPSLCSLWTVKDVAAHMLVVPTMSKGKVFVQFASSGFNLDKMSAKLVDRLTGSMSDGEIAAATRSSAASTSVPPGLKPMAALGEVLIHSSDIAEAVGRPVTIPVDHFVAGLEYSKDVEPVLRSKSRIAGLKLTATDADWSAGDGPEVTGTAQQLLLAMTGRSKALDHLGGDGVETLRSR